MSCISCWRIGTRRGDDSRRFDRSKKLAANIEIVAEAQEEYDPNWLRNAVEEPLDEADIERESDLED